MKDSIKNKDYQEIYNYINIYDKCYVSTWRGFSAYENICMMQNYKKNIINNENKKEISTLKYKIKRIFEILSE